MSTTHTLRAAARIATILGRLRAPTEGMRRRNYRRDLRQESARLARLVNGGRP